MIEMSPLAKNNDCPSGRRVCLEKNMINGGMGDCLVSEHLTRREREGQRQRGNWGTKVLIVYTTDIVFCRYAATRP